MDYKEFLELVKIIDNETGMMSVSSYADKHPAMQKIIDVGIPACQFIADYWVEYPQRGPHFFYALREITGLDPAFPRQFWGCIDKLEGAWISLLYYRGLIKEKIADWNIDKKEWKVRDK